jgi:hypothetical protein
MLGPESRLLADALLEARHAAATAGNRNHSMPKLHAQLAGLDSATWRNPVEYGTLLDPRPGVKREKNDDDCPGARGRRGRRRRNIFQRQRRSRASNLLMGQRLRLGSVLCPSRSILVGKATT